MSTKQESFVQCPVLYLSPLVVVLLVLVDSKCPLDWVEYDSNCIQFNKQQQSWTDAAVRRQSTVVWRYCDIV